MIPNSFFFLCSGVSRAWIGLQDQDGSGSFEWVDGEKLAARRWSVTQLDGGGRCAMIKTRGRRTAVWRDAFCDKTLNFMCQKRKSKTFGKDRVVFSMF